MNRDSKEKKLSDRIYRIHRLKKNAQRANLKDRGTPE
jgi:hypothetical protein